ncbi:hypothetical protein ZIOFF_044394 [Zingiber officinale]|uniref:RRM domain-containing protein n=1 Tax=Zingiber officinale TaxID=94328 RepID=A0A8J5KX88_ZINOF|nr:hypothetical protein ZIOFF_044394 [Zingiber officinale]
MEGGMRKRATWRIGSSSSSYRTRVRDPRVMAALRSGVRRLFSISAFSPPPSAAVPPPAEPSTNLFVSGELPSFSHLRLSVPSRFNISLEFYVYLLNSSFLFSGLSKRTTSEGLREAFSKFGQVIYARVVTDRLSGYSKGFGFVRYSTLEEAAQGITGMDGKFLDGWVIFAEYARPRLPPPDQTQAPPPPQQTSEPPFNHQ